MVRALILTMFLGLAQFPGITVDSVSGVNSERVIALTELLLAHSNFKEKPTTVTIHIWPYSDFENYLKDLTRRGIISPTTMARVEGTGGLVKGLSRTEGRTLTIWLYDDVDEYVVHEVMHYYVQTHYPDIHYENVVQALTESFLVSYYYKEWMRNYAPNSN